jgi:hypothetical protein
MSEKDKIEILVKRGREKVRNRERYIRERRTSRGGRKRHRLSSEGGGGDEGVKWRKLGFSANSSHRERGKIKFYVDVL